MDLVCNDEGQTPIMKDNGKVNQVRENNGGVTMSRQVSGGSNYEQAGKQRE